MKLAPLVFSAFFSVCYATSSYAYDAESAKSYEKMFAPAVGAKTDSELHYIKADAVIKKILAKEDLVFLLIVASWTMVRSL